MSTYRAPSSAGREARPDWATVLVRMFLVVLPSVLLGFVVATLLVPATFLVEHPGLGWILNVPPGLLAGLGLGLVLRPARSALAVHLGVAALLTAVVVLVLLAIAQLRLPGPASGLDASSIVLGVVVSVLVQSAVAGLVWRSRGQRPR